MGRNVSSPGGWPHDYRCPDIVILGLERFALDRNVYIDGGPDVVVEIESPGDETREKLLFYARIGVGEAWIVDRDTREIEILALRGGSYEARPRDAAGWASSPFAGIEARAEGGRLLIRMAGDDATLERLPEE
jgi:Uma2 family endonuclease